MKILGLNISISRNSSRNTKHETRAFDPQLWLTGQDFSGTGATMTNAYEQSAWVYRAVNAIADQVANIPFLFSHGERGRENLITSGPLHTFYNQPSPTMDRFQYWELRILWLLLRGQCFRLPIYAETPTPTPTRTLTPPSRGLGFLHGTRNTEHASCAVHEPSTPSLHDLTQPRRKLRSVAYLDPARMVPIVQNHVLMGWRYNATPGAPIESQVFLPEEVWHDKLPNPFDPYRGLAPLHVANMSTRTDFAAANHMRAMLECNADTGLIIRADNQLSDEQREQIVASLRARRARRTVSPNTCTFLWGATEVIQPTLSSTDLQFLENRKILPFRNLRRFRCPRRNRRHYRPQQIRCHARRSPQLHRKSHRPSLRPPRSRRTGHRPRP